MHRWEALLKEAVLLGDWNSWRKKAAVNKQAQVTNGANNPLCVFIWALDLWLLGEAQRKMLEKNCNLSGDRWRRLLSSVRLSSLVLPQMHTHCLRQHKNWNTNWLQNVWYITVLYSRYTLLSLELIKYDLLMNSKCNDWAADVAEEGQHIPKNYSCSVKYSGCQMLNES